MNNQKGIVLIIALIALVAMSLAGISLMRTVDTTNVISGNLAFGEAAVQMEDVGEAAAYQWVTSNMMNGSVATSCQVIQSKSPGTACSGSSFYYPDALPIDSQTKLPNPGTGNSLNWSPPVPTGVPAGYQVQYIIERMCGTNVGAAANTNGAAPTFAYCMAAPVYFPASVSNGAVNGVTLQNTGNGYNVTPPTVVFDNTGSGGSGATATATITGGTVGVTVTSGGSGYGSGPIAILYGGDGSGATTLVSGTGRLYFRVTVMVTGPRNTTGMAQYFIGSEDTVN